MKFTLVTVAALSISALTSAHGALQYTVTDLGVIPSPPNTFTPNSVALSINNLGQVAGAALTAPGYNDAVIFQNGGITRLGTLAGPSETSGTSATALALNNFGQVVGASTTFVSGQLTNVHAFLYSSGTMLDLGTLGRGSSQAYAINDSGVVVGATGVSSSSPRAFIYSEGTMTDLGLAGSSEALDINNSGQVVGRYQNNHAFLYSAGTTIDLGSLGGPTFATSINDIGQIVGISTLGGPSNRAFLYSGGSMTDLGTLGGSSSSAYSINNSGQVFGASTLANGEEHPFFYTDGVMYNLDDLITDRGGVGNITFEGSGALNDAGQIVGIGNVGGAPHAVLLTPTVVPEPSTAFFGVMAGMAFIFRRTRNARNG